MSYSDWLQERERQLNDWDPIGRLYETGALSGDRQCVELLPTFYAQFGPLLDFRLRSIQLRKESYDWMVRIWREQHDVRDESVSDLLKGGVDTYPIEEIVRILLNESVRFEVADQLGIFNPPALRLMVANAIENERAHDRGYDMASKHWNPLADFELACARQLADEVASGIDLVSRTIKNLKSESATGILGDENRSRWDEIVCDLGSTDSLLFEGFKNDIDSAVYEVFSALPRTQQLAIWMSHDHIRDDFDDTPRGWEEHGVEGFTLHDLDVVLEDVTRAVLGVARNEAESRE
jgi:hypothetical protein